MPNNRPESALLIVDDEQPVRRALRRVFQQHFAVVSLATGPSDAESVLAVQPITHILCDHWFGSGQPLGLDLLPKWKAEHPTVCRTVLLTGFDVSKLVPDLSIDAVLSKLIGSEELVRAVKGDTDDDASE